MIIKDKRVLMRTPNYRIEKRWVGEWKCFLDRTNGSNICSGSYDYCLKVLDLFRELDELERKIKEKLVPIWRN